MGKRDDLDPRVEPPFFLQPDDATPGGFERRDRTSVCPNIPHVSGEIFGDPTSPDPDANSVYSCANGHYYTLAEADAHREEGRVVCGHPGCGLLMEPSIP